MNTMNTKELNPVQHFLAKYNFWIRKKEEQIGSIVSLLPIVFGALVILAIEIILPTNLYPFFPVATGVITATIAIEIIILTIGGKYKKFLPEIQIELEKEKIERLLGKVISLESSDARVNKNTVEQLIKETNIEFMKEGNPQSHLESIRETAKKLEEFVSMVETIRAKESRIKTLKQECENLPQEEEELSQFEQKLEDFQTAIIS